MAVLGGDTCTTCKLVAQQLIRSTCAEKEKAGARSLLHASAKHWLQLSFIVLPIRIVSQHSHYHHIQGPHSFFSSMPYHAHCEAATSPLPLSLLMPQHAWPNAPPHCHAGCSSEDIAATCRALTRTEAASQLAVLKLGPPGNSEMMASEGSRWWTDVAALLLALPRLQAAELWGLDESQRSHVRESWQGARDCEVQEAEAALSGTRLALPLQ